MKKLRPQLPFFLFAFLSFVFSGCIKDGKLVSQYYFEGEVNGIPFIERRPAIILSPGARPSPLLRYSFREEHKLLSFSTEIHDNRKNDNSGQYYFVSFYIPITEPLTAGKKYFTYSIQGESPVMSNYQQLQKYLIPKIPVASIKEMGPDRLSVADGYIEITSIDYEKRVVDGKIDIHAVSPRSEDEEKILHLRGSFHCVMERDY